VASRKQWLPLISVLILTEVEAIVRYLCVNVYAQLMLLACAQTCLELMYLQGVSTWNGSVTLLSTP